MKTDITHDELIGVFSPLWDATQMIERLKSVAGDGFANEFLTALEYKLESAKTPLKEHIDKIERENPDQFTLD